MIEIRATEFTPKAIPGITDGFPFFQADDEWVFMSYTEYLAFIDGRVDPAKSRANHTGTQLANTISNFDAAVDARTAGHNGDNTIHFTQAQILIPVSQISDFDAIAEKFANKGIPNGYAPLNASGLIPSTNLPSFVDDVLEYDDLASFPGAGETGKIYVAKDNGKQYRWSGSAYIEVSPNVYSTDAEVETAYNNRVSVVDQPTAEAGTSSSVFRWTAQRIQQLLASLGLLKSVYDPTSVNGDAFDMDNMAEAANAKKMTAAERTKLSGLKAWTVVEVTASRNITAADDNTMLECTNATNITLTFADGLPDNFSCEIMKTAVGNVALAKGATGTLDAEDGNLNLTKLWAAATVFQRTGNAFRASGSLTA